MKPNRKIPFATAAILVTAAAAPCAPGPWWMAETAMNGDGGIDLTSKPWWPHAEALQPGESFAIPSGSEGGGLMLIQCRLRERDPSQAMIVWILDDDGDMDPENPAGDLDNDCYVADYGRDGIADRMVDYMSADDDGVPDEMDIRYYIDGELRRAWFGEDLDGDGAMWDLIDCEYTGDFFESDPYGDNLIYMNKYDPARRSWVPISECPFSFHDTDGDGRSDTVVRFSAAPLAFDPDADPDYANSRARYEGPYNPAMESIGLVNVRYSFDIDNQSSEATPLDYEMGFNMTGAQPYDYPGMAHANPLRRPPRETVRAPHGGVLAIADNYPAEQTGFSWMEYPDASIRIGHPSKPEDDRRWEGVFWTWSRRIMHNTGGPVQHWNMRREFMDAPSTRRELYYSPVDRRLHLKGAPEGWMRVGCLTGDENLGEVRTFDTDGDGYFDRWEYYMAGNPVPYRTADAPHAANVDLGDDWDAIRAHYNQTALPEAIRLNRQLIESMESIPAIAAEPLPPYFGKAMDNASSPGERRYVLDLMREHRFIQFRAILRDRAARAMRANEPADSRGSIELREGSERAWAALARLSLLEAAYGRGDYETALTPMREAAHDFSMDR